MGEGAQCTSGTPQKKLTFYFAKVASRLSVGLGVDVAHLGTMLEALGFILDACKPVVVALAYVPALWALGVGDKKELKVILCYGAVEFEATLHYMRPGFKPRNKILTECSRAGS